MNKLFMKVISVILCITILCAGAGLFAEAKRKVDYPILFVTGIGQSYSYYYENPEDAKKDLEENTVRVPSEENPTGRASARWNLFCNDFSFAFKEPKTYLSIIQVALGLVVTALTGHNIVSRSAVDNLVTTLFRYNIVDENGNLPDNIITPLIKCPVSEMNEEQYENFYRTIPCQDISGEIGEENLYVYNYSPFSFIYQDSEGLDKFINEVVLAQTGAEKVVLVPMSMGASIVSAYLQDHGSEGKVARVVSIVGAWYGSDVISDLIELKYADDAPEQIYNGLLAKLIGEPWGYLVNVVIRVFSKDALRSFIDELLDSIVENLVIKTPELMAVCAMDRYPQVRASRLAGRDDLKYVLEQTDKYYQAQSNLRTTMETLNREQGVDFFFIAGSGLEYGGCNSTEYVSEYQFFRFLNSSVKTNSDEIIQISSTAPGASYVPAGTKFSDEYLNSHDAAYISKDSSVDLSTCYFPDRVWVFEGQNHQLDYNNTALKLALSLACGEIDNSNDCAETYPRFNQSRNVKPLTRSYIPHLNSWLETNTPTEAQQQLIDKNNALAQQMLDRTINDRKADDKIISDYEAMLYELGVYQKSDEKTNDTLTKILKSLSDWCYDKFGARGFFKSF